MSEKGRLGPASVPQTPRFDMRSLRCTLRISLATTVQDLYLTREHRLAIALSL